MSRGSLIYHDTKLKILMPKSPSMNKICFLNTKDRLKVYLMSKTYYVTELLEDKAKGQSKGNPERNQSINRSCIFLINVLQNSHLSHSSTSTPSSTSPDFMPDLCSNDTLGHSLSNPINRCQTNLQIPNCITV